MPYDLDIRAERDHLRVEVSGTRVAGREVGNAVDAWKKVVEKSRETGLTRVLVISNVPGRVSAAVASLIVTAAEEVESGKGFKLAMVFADHESLISHKLTRSYAVNLGYDVDIFGNEEQARKWLLRDRGPGSS